MSLASYSQAASGPSQPSYCAGSTALRPMWSEMPRALAASGRVGSLARRRARRLAAAVGARARISGAARVAVRRRISASSFFATSR